MRIENEMLSRFNSSVTINEEATDLSISNELDFFFNNVMDSVVEYFKEREEVIVR